MIKWSDKYRIGIDIIDNDHKGLFEAVNQLEEKVKFASSGEKIELWNELNYLSIYVNEHFNREEKLMQEHAYPQYREHALMHKKIKRAVFAIRKIYATNSALIDPQKLIAFFSGWLKNHIINDDLSFEPYFRSEDYG